MYEFNACRDNGEPPSERRFPIHQDVHYRYLNNPVAAGVTCGKTVYMSSHEIRFTTVRSLDLGESVEVAVAWPALLDGTCPLKLVICGHVISNDSGTAVVKIEHHQFRTRAAAR